MVADDTVRAVKRAFEDHDVQEVLEQSAKRALKDREETVSVSDFGAQNWLQMRTAAGLSFEAVALPAFVVDVVPPPFEWNTDPEPRQADRYNQQSLCVYDVRLLLSLIYFNDAQQCQALACGSCDCIHKMHPGSL